MRDKQDFIDEHLDEHYHCLICEESYSTKEKAEKCFKEHNEIEHLRWVTREVCWMKSYLYDLLAHIDYIDEKYDIDNDKIIKDKRYAFTFKLLELPEGCHYLNIDQETRSIKVYAETYEDAIEKLKEIKNPEVHFKIISYDIEEAR